MTTYFNCKATKCRDNYETPEWCWELIFKFYTNREKVVWAPFYCKGLCADYLEKYHGPNFIHSDNDFFNWTPEFDCIIDNPPYSCKEKVFERCIALGKPFALYVPLDTLERKYIKDLMNDIGLQLVIPKKRTNFITDYDVKYTCPPHKTIWICWKMNLLDGRQIIFE